MADHGDRTGRDTLDAVLQRLRDLEGEVQQLKGGNRLSLDRGDTNSFEVDKGAFEGQVMIQYDTEKPWYFSNGVWRPFTTGLTLTHAEGRYQIDGGAVTVTSGSGVQIDWTHVSGDSLLDLSTTNAPKPVVTGWYEVNATFSTESVPGGPAAGSSYQALLEFHGAQFKHQKGTVTIPNVNLPGPGQQEAGQGTVNLAGHMRTSTDYISLQLENYDSASQILTFDTIEVSMVYASA